MKWVYTSDSENEEAGGGRWVAKDERRKTKDNTLGSFMLLSEKGGAALLCINTISGNRSSGNSFYGDCHFLEQLLPRLIESLFAEFRKFKIPPFPKN